METFALLYYVIIYYNVDAIGKHCYIPLLQKYIDYDNTVITTVEPLYFSLKSTSIFMLFLYFMQMLNSILVTKSFNVPSIALCCIYVKYLFDILINPEQTLFEFEMNRTIMWIFTTPLMLKMYCETNDLSVWDIKAQYHTFSISSLLFILPFKNMTYIYLCNTVFYIPAVIFIKRLYDFTHLPFTYLFIYIWLTFAIIHILDMTNLCSKNYIHSFYNIADTLCKFICSLVISQINEKDYIDKENMDLHSVNFISYMIKNIKQYENDNINLTPKCRTLVNHYNKNFMKKIPMTNSRLKLELLKKILPFDLDKDYMNVRTGIIAGAGAGAGKNKEFTFTCVMFTDIINYTELAKKYNGDTIFKLLDKVYFKFDTIIKKYYHLQKIETIGDAYMVVGDIFRDELNYKIVVKEIILLACEFIKEIKTIKTPDGKPLCVRIGMTMGTVNVGILGNEIPRFCIVGNTVNVAARLQSTADADTIQMSRHIYEQVTSIEFEVDFEIIKKDNVFLKNIGSVTTYNITP